MHSVRKVAALSLDFVDVEKRYSSLHESHHANVVQHLTCVFSTRVFSDSMQTMHVRFDCEKLTRVIQTESQHMTIEMPIIRRNIRMSANTR